MTGNDFARALDRAIMRSSKLIEAKQLSRRRLNSWAGALG
jgi:hypothetical protein